jgi:hypothetical protein
MLKRRRKKLKIFSIFKKTRKSKNRNTKFDEIYKRVDATEQLEIINKHKKDKFADKASIELASADNTHCCSYNAENNDNQHLRNTHKTRTKPKNKENREYVEKVRNQVKEVLQEKYDDSFDNLFSQFENNGYINKDNFLFRLIFMILKKYGFIDIFDENGEIDPNAIDEILKSIINDAYKLINDSEIDKKEVKDEYKGYSLEKTSNNCCNENFYEDE